MKLLTNPIVLRMVVGMVAAVAAFVIGLVIIRRLRRSLVDDVSALEQPPSAESFPLHTYHAVIQQLKQQKHELQSMRQAEHRRAKTSENISAAVLSNLSSGVMFFTPNGLLRQANAAAKQILGLASPIGMSAPEMFRDARLSSPNTEGHTKLAEVIQASLRDKAPLRQVEGRYVTPANNERVLQVTVSSVRAPSGDVLGVACLLNDLTELAQIRLRQELHGDISAEMALELRTSLTTIAGYAQQLAANHDPELARQLAADIASEAAHLDHTIGGFLASEKAARAAAGT
jgi:nitrogen fixation/metabolism regulation signal transduction histidine kinase